MFSLTRLVSSSTLSRCISVGTRKGYTITNCDPFGRVYTLSKLDGPTAIALNLEAL